MSPGSADLVIRGPVYTAVPAARWAGGVAIASGRIVAVGSAEDVERLIGPGTRTLDARGGMVAPGFQDSHVHPDGGGLALSQCRLDDVRGVEAYRARIREFAEAHPEAEWILGHGWSLDDFPGGTPHRSLIDDLVPDRPVYLPNRDGHGAWVNSTALAVAGITRDTPDPRDGRIERDRDGAPFGVLHEGAMDLVERLAPAPTPAQLVQALRDAQSYLHSFGVTAWQDAHVSPETLAAYRALEDRGELSARVVGALWWARDRDVEQVEELLALRDQARTGRVRATSVKIMQDGIIENFTSGLIEPYLDGDEMAGERRGLSFVPPERLDRAVTLLDRLGFQVHIHAIGDRAVREALDACQAARTANGRSDLRHHIAHLQVVHPDDVPRFAELEVVANAQPLWACLDGQMLRLCVPFLGEERTTHQYPFGALLRAGARLAFGSDWPVSSPNPLEEMQVAVTRVPFDEPEVEPFLPEERLSLEDAYDAFTIGTAFVNHLDRETGTVEEGKAADLVFLDRNPFEDDPSEIGQAHVLLTLVDGAPVFTSGDLDWSS